MAATASFDVTLKSQLATTMGNDRVDLLYQIYDLRRPLVEYPAFGAGAFWARN
jgi:hypothetical protein